MRTLTRKDWGCGRRSGRADEAAGRSRSGQPGMRLRREAPNAGRIREEPIKSIGDEYEDSIKRSYK